MGIDIFHNNNNFNNCSGHHCNNNHCNDNHCNDYNTENINSFIGKINNANEFNCYLRSFFNKVSNTLSLDYCDVDKIKINISVTNKTKPSNICRAIVQDNITGQCRRCTRKKKYGEVCGLHNKRKNSFKMVPQNTQSETSKIFLDLYSLITKKHTQNKSESMRKIAFNYIEYMINTDNGEVFINNDDNNLVYIDHINNLDLPFII